MTISTGKGGFIIKKLIIFPLLLLLFFANAINTYAAPFTNSSWISVGTNGDNTSYGILGRRLGPSKEEAIEFSILMGDNKGYGLDYLLFNDLDEKTSWFGGIGLYRQYYYDENGNPAAENLLALSVGIQRQIGRKYGLGIGYNTVRGIFFQTGIGF